MRRLTAGLAAAALLLVACGDEADTGSDPTEQATPAGGTSEGDPTEAASEDTASDDEDIVAEPPAGETRARRGRKRGAAVPGRAGAAGRVRGRLRDM